MKKVLLVNGSAPPLKCGVGFYGEKLIEYLAKNMTVDLLTTANLGMHMNGAAEVFRLSNWKIGNIPKMTASIRESNPDYIHIQYHAKGYGRDLGINLLPLWLKITGSKIPRLLTLHEHHETGILGKTRNIITATFADKVLVSNNYDLDALPRFLRKKCVVVPIGSNLLQSTAKEGAFEKLLIKGKLSPSLPTIVYFGFANPNKGIDVLIKSSPNIKANVLLITELDKESPYQHMLSSLVDDAKKLGASIYVSGYLDDAMVSTVLRNSQLFVLSQPLPLTAKSSTAIASVIHGVPVVSKAAIDPKYNNPYINGVNAILLETMDEANLSIACNDLLASSEMMHKLKNETKKLAGYFDWDSIAARHDQEYNAM